jgi:hypothetical protein
MAMKIGGIFGNTLRAFHIVKKVIAAMTRLRGLIEETCCGTCVNAMLRSKPHTLPS